MGDMDERRILKIMKLCPERVWTTKEVATIKQIWECGKFRGTPQIEDVENFLSILGGKYADGTDSRWGNLIRKVKGGWMLTEEGKKCYYPVEEG